jgi:hypothetical protein
MTNVPSQLTWNVYVTAEEPIVTDDLPPGATERREGGSLINLT